MCSLVVNHFKWTLTAFLLKTVEFYIHNLNWGCGFHAKDENRRNFEKLAKVSQWVVFINPMETDEIWNQCNSQYGEFSSLAWKPMKFYILAMALSVVYSSQILTNEFPYPLTCFVMVYVFECSFLTRRNLCGENIKRMFLEEIVFRLRHGSVLLQFLGPLKKALVVDFKVPVGVYRWLLCVL